ncbi:Tat pathway signal protein [Nonomuraea dietziae]|uniref:Tetratricopeptide (TPR) repeat protein n=1 Tax=Nonomuraea dietziae TaxID=65515 RepID=A0A7W5VK60_9ACTN|nr:Tat pathway signal protein [Nonomuraea dietziae]MBB3733800.1 tetratricopeptide (TPR) repeat protein [Nonomuraea dietziae]
MARTRNERLAALLSEAGWSRTQAANEFNRAAQHLQQATAAGIGRSHISMWIGGTQPSGAAPVILCQALSHRLNRLITPDELGFAGPGSAPGVPDWRADPLPALTDLGRNDLDPDRRRLLVSAGYSAAWLALPGEAWWRAMTELPPPSPGTARRVSSGDVATVQEFTLAFSHIDQRRGGGHARKALVQFLRSEVTSLLSGTFSSDQVRRAMFAAAGELTYLSGWMAFDNGEHALAQQYFALALKLAARSADEPLSGHILRAMAHQALDLSLHRQGLELSAASLHGQRYASATPRERALLGVVHARALASTGDRQAAAKALLQAENDLAAASAEIPEPNRTFFFGEASLAHETACTLAACGDRRGAVRHFQRSVRTRGEAFARTHAVTLGYLGAVQLATGVVEEACATWQRALEAMEEGIHSGRARQTVVDMRRLLSPYRRRQIPAVASLDARAAAYLAQ